MSLFYVVKWHDQNMWSEKLWFKFPNGGWVLTRPEYFLLTPFSPYSRPLFLHTVNDHVIFHDNDDGGGGDVDDDEKPLVGIAC